MNDNNLKNLIKDLKTEGALEKQAEDFAFLSKNLSNLYSFERSGEFKYKFLEQELLEKNKFFASRQMFATAFFSLILLLGFASIVSAQGSLFGQPLYPVKIASENIASFTNPSFKGEILKRRSEEIKQLSGKKDGDNFLNTVNEYEKVLNENKKISLQKIEESRRNLEEARENSLEENKEDLERIIIKTESRQGEVKGEEDKSESPEDNNREINKDFEGRPRF